MDANEPDVDHYDIKQMKFFDNKGNGAKILFDTLSNMGLEDSFAIQYDKSNYEEGKPLAVSHVIKGCKKPRRYDFIFINTYYFDSVNVDYLYDEAIELGTDHAIVAADVELS